MYFAHSIKGEDRIRWQVLPTHLRNVATLTSARAQKFDAAPLGALVGLLHDLGKYAPQFQDYISGKAPSPDHATAGAREILRRVGSGTADRYAALIGAYCIAGHHGGLPDWGGEQPLSHRLTKDLAPIDPAWETEIEPETDDLFPKHFKRHPNLSLAAFQLAMFGRMLFSCLVDADYRDTESFYVATEGGTVDREWPALTEQVDRLLARFDVYMAEIPARRGNLTLNRLRTDILAHARGKASLPRGVFTLDVPTGGGKTLASLGFALAHAKSHDMSRIVYGIPFTSIIDQTAAIFRDVLGDDVILEHHASIDDKRQDCKRPEDEGEREARDKMRLAMEDWAAPVVVTTNVQLFESLFANRTSRCRKLHNLCNAVIILDEAQTIPLPVLRPCVAALDELVRNYGCSVVLCTATQPALSEPRFKGGFVIGPERELAPDPPALARVLQRVTLAIRTAPTTDAELVTEIASVEQALVIVNSRKHALDLYKAAKAAELTGVIHLTTRQTGADRRRILAAIREDLANERPCRVIATSLVEAGVDLDFPRVWRAQAGLDQITQAAGRCNRESKRPVAESIVTVFTPAEAMPPPEIRPFIEAMGRVIKKFPNPDDLFSPSAIQEYFNEVYWQRGDKRLDQITVRNSDGRAGKMSVLDAFLWGRDTLDFPYRTVAEGFHLIENGMAPVIIAVDDEPRSLLQRLNVGNITAGAAARRLQTFIVQVPPAWRRKLIANGHAAFVPGYGDQFAVLDERSKLYTSEIGLLWEEADSIGDFLI